MKYLKVFTDFAIDIEALNDTEVGRLFRAMLEYAELGTERELKGNERFIWGTAKKNIDNQAESYKKQCETNKKIATNRYEALRSVTKGYEPCQDKEKDKEKDKENIKKSNRFHPPSVEEVKKYCQERGNGIDAEHFINYYAANGWRVGKQNKMQDWKAAVRNWEYNSLSKKQKTEITAPKAPTQQDVDRMRKMLEGLK